MYHRVAEPRFDPWRLAVAPAHFRDQLEALKRLRTPMSVRELVVLREEGRLPRDAVAISFDDGYVDNIEAALPALRDADLPATFFIASGTIGAGHEFWWDELLRLVAERRAGCDLTLTLGSGFRLALPPPDGDAERDIAVYRSVWEVMQPLRRTEREPILQRLREAIDTVPPHVEDYPMERSALARLAAAPRIEIGGHTVTHPRLPALTEAEQLDEMVAGRSACAAMAGTEVIGFAYPYGVIDGRTGALAREAGFRYACTTRPAAVRDDDGPFDLPRLQAENESGAALARRLALI